MPRIVTQSMLAVVIGVLAGLASAGFLTALTYVTALFGAYPWVLWLLPVIGVGIAWVYQRYGTYASAGNNLILEQIHEPQSPGVPLRMFPLVLVSTLLTHLGGGSAGREGTAVQMGGSIAAALARMLRVDARDTRVLLMSGISAGFGSVFGTPLAGTVFGMEVLAIGGMRYVALIPCLIAACVGDWTVRALGVPHAHYHIAAIPALSPLLLAKIGIAAAAFAAASALFSDITHTIDHYSKKYLPQPLVRVAVGGCVVIALTLLSGTYAYNGLSLPLLQAAFVSGGVPTWGFALKLLFTAVTIGFGYKGGEVTPLFVIGAMLGASLAIVLQVPVDFMAALGFIAVFAAAANTPLACIFMGVELFGSEVMLLCAVCTLLAYTMAGHRGIYTAQRIMTHKHDHDTDIAPHTRLRDMRQTGGGWWRR